MGTVTGAEPLSRRVSSMLSPISPGRTPTRERTHTVSPARGGGGEQERAFRGGANTYTASAFYEDQECYGDE